MKEIEVGGKRKVILHSATTVRGILEVEELSIEKSGLSSQMASEAALIFTIPPFQDQEAFILKNRWGPSGKVSIDDLNLYKALAEKWGEN